MSSDENLIRYDINKKSMFVAYLLWFFLGGIGAHRFYTGNITSAIIMLLLWIISIPLIFADGIGFFTGAIVYIWVFPIDLFLTAYNVKKRNTQIAQDILK